MEGAVRRKANMPLPFDWAMPLLLFFVLCIGIAQLVFAYNLVSTFRRKHNAKDELPGHEEEPLIQSENQGTSTDPKIGKTESSKKRSTK